MSANFKFLTWITKRIQITFIIHWQINKLNLECLSKSPKYKNSSSPIPILPKSQNLVLIVKLTQKPQNGKAKVWTVFPLNATKLTSPNQPHKSLFPSKKSPRSPKTPLLKTRKRKIRKAGKRSCHNQKLKKSMKKCSAWSSTICLKSFTFGWLPKLKMIKTLAVSAGKTTKFRATSNSWLETTRTAFSWELKINSSFFIFKRMRTRT